MNFIPLTLATTGAEPLPAWGRPMIIGAAVGAIASAVGGMTLGQVLPRLQGAIQLPLHLPTLPPDLLAPVLAVLCALAGLLMVLSLSPRRRAARGRDRLSTLRPRPSAGLAGLSLNRVPRAGQAAHHPRPI